ncbi:MAG: hypothetical protein ACAI25_12495 [Planctomycetota bacterium]
MRRPIEPLFAVLALFLIGSPALAGEPVIIKLKDGRKVEGEILEKTDGTYVVATAGGKKTLERLQVESVSPVPLWKTKAALADAVKAIADADESDRDRIRQERMQDASKALPLEDLVGVIAEDLGRNASTPEQLLAYELAVARPDAARPVLLRALKAWEPISGRPVLVLRALEQLEDDAEGRVEDGLGAKLEALIAAAFPVNVLAPTYAKLATKRSWPRLQALILGLDPELDVGSSVTQVAAAVLAREDDPDKALEPLIAKADTRAKTEAALYRLSFVLELGGATKGGRATERFFDDCLRVVTLALSESPESENAHRLHASLGRAAARVGTDRMRDLLLRILETDRRELKIVTIRAFALVKTPEVQRQVMRDLVDRLSKDEWSWEEQKAFFATLYTLAGTSPGSTVPAWKKYVDSLER